MKTLLESILDKDNKKKTYNSEWLLDDEGEVNYGKFIDFLKPYKWDKQGHKDPDKFVYVTTMVDSIYIDMYIPLGNSKYNRIIFLFDECSDSSLVVKLYSNNRDAAKRWGINTISAPEPEKYSMYEVPIDKIKGLLKVSCDYISTHSNTGSWTDRMYQNSDLALTKAQKYLEQLTGGAYNRPEKIKFDLYAVGELGATTAAIYKVDSTDMKELFKEFLKTYSGANWLPARTQQVFKSIGLI